jgi:hypothetical protein
MIVAVSLLAGPLAAFALVAGPFADGSQVEITGDPAARVCRRARTAPSPLPPTRR